jgi:chromate reductase
MSASDDIHVLGFAGSLRAKSINKGLLRTAGELMPDGMTLEIFDLAAIPLYNEDVLQAGFPDGVQQFRDRIAAADALLIAMPEYNFSMAGVLKNAIDWASRPPDHPLNNKPVAIFGATPGGYGTTRAQHHFRQMAAALNMHVVNKPEVAIPAAAGKFDDSGRLTDEASLGFVKDQLEALKDWTLRLR